MEYDYHILVVTANLLGAVTVAGAVAAVGIIVTVDGVVSRESQQLMRSGRSCAVVTTVQFCMLLP